MRVLSFIAKLGAALHLALLALFVPKIAHADFPVVVDFPNTGFYQARYQRSKNDIALIELTGNYNRDTTEGKPNIEPRTVIAKEFYRVHQDQYDFIVVFSNFEFDTKDALAFHIGVQNKVKGIGLTEYDNTAVFGSGGKLLGYIDMAALSRYVTNPYDARFDQVLQVFAHEFMHQWGSNLRLKSADGSLNDLLLGKDNAHWSFLLDSGASVEYGHQWKENGDGTFTSVASRQFFSPLDLYLMGMYKKEEVPPFFLIENSDVDKTRLPQNGVTINGSRRNITIDEVVAANGERIPNADQAQKEFRLGFVLLSRAGEAPTDEQIAAVATIRKAISTRLAVLTGGRALAHSYLVKRDLAANDPGAGDDGGTIRTGGANLLDGMTWLKAKQNDEGYWQDNGFTKVRDTIVAFDTVTNLDGTAFPGRQKALDWLNGQELSNTDYVARRLVASQRAGMSTSADTARLIGLQNADGGWGVAPGYQSNPLDTALSILALRIADTTDVKPAIDSAVNFLVARQNADGGWGNAIGGVSRTAVTTTALQALTGKTVTPTLYPKAIAFLASRQNTDGGFGDSPSTVHDTANVVLALLSQNALGDIRSNDAISYVSSTQRTDGSWDGSIYSTSLALRLLKSSGIFNWAVSDLKSDPQQPRDGQQTQISFKVANNGSKPAPAGLVRVYDGDPNLGGVQIGSDIHVPGLLAGDSADLKLAWSTFDKAGSHTLYAVVDPENLESEGSKSDNRLALRVEVSEAPVQADLAVHASGISVSPASPSSLPSTLSFSARVSNIGKTNSNNVRIVLRELEGGAAKIVDEETVNLLGRSTQVVNLTAILTRAGLTKYTVTVDPDGLIPEVDESNNQAEVSVETSSALDVAVLESEAKIARTPVYLGTDAVFNLKVRNAGTQNSPPFKVRYSVSDGTTSVEVATRTLQLEAGAFADQEVVWRAEMGGALALKVELDPDNILAESDKTNNVATVPLAVIQAQGANLTVSYKDLQFAPKPALEGKPFVLSQLVRNTGNQTANNIEVAFFDGDPSAGRIIGTVQTIPTLAPGESAQTSVTWARYPDADDHLIFVVADPDSKLTEVTRDDNLAFEVASPLSLPDLAVSSGDIVVTPQSPKPGDTLTIAAKVSNLGKQPGANVIVRAFDGDPMQGGRQIGADQNVANFAGLSNQSFSFSMPAGTVSADRAIFVSVDPANAIEEKDENNNIARQGLVVQSGDFYVSNRFFSPNGDGVKDETTFGFRLKSVADVTVVAVNKRGQIVRTFGGPQFNGIQSGSISWDGLDQLGRIVQDGNYQLRVVGKDGSVLGEVTVSLDTNRSSIIEAIDTQFEHVTNLSCELDQVSNPRPKFTADEERVFFFNYGYDGSNFPETWYRLSSNGSDVTPLVNPENFRRSWNWNDFSISLNGEKFAHLTKKDEGGEDQLWVMDGDGRNRKMLMERHPEGGDFDRMEQTSTLNQDGSAFLSVIDGRLLSIPTDGVSAETILFNPAQEDFGGEIEEVDYSPDRRLGLVTVVNDGPRSYFLVDMITGRRRELPEAILEARPHFRKKKWAPNSKLIAMGGFLRDLGVEEGFANNARFYVFDQEFNLIRTLQTDLPCTSDDNDYYGGLCKYGYDGDVGVLDSLDWAGNSAEFVFAHSYELGGEGGEGHVLMHADVLTGEVKPIEETRVQTWWSSHMPSTYMWVPNERTVLRMTDRWFCEEDGMPELAAAESSDTRSSCIDAILLDEQNKIKPLFKNWHNAPDVQESIWDTEMRPHSVLPSGRKLLFSSYRAAYDGASSCYNTGPDEYTVGSLLNMTADLRAVRSSKVGGLILRGTAADVNFSRYAIEYASTAQPNDWRVVMPASGSPVVDGVFTNWVPPGYGNYLLRLTVEDTAGNKRQQIKRVTWSDTPSITDVYKDLEFISPNGDLTQDQMQLHYRVLEPVHLEFTVYDKDNKPVRSLARDHFAVGQEAFFNWDGRDDYGRVVADGQYRIGVLDYEFVVNVDNTMPLAAAKMENAFGFREVVRPNGSVDRFVEYKPTLTWSSEDANYASMVIERMAGEAGEWEEYGRFPTLANAGTKTLRPIDFVNMAYRLTVADRAGNRTVVDMPMGEEQVFFYSYANHARNNPPQDNRWIDLPEPNPYYTPAVQIGDLRRIDTIIGSAPARLTFAETVRQPIKKVVLQFREVLAAESTMKLADLNSVAWNEVLVSDFIQGPNEPGSTEDFVSVGNLPSEHFFKFLWSLEGVKPGSDYLVRIKVVNQDDAEYFALYPGLLRLNNVLKIKRIADNRPTDMLLDADALWAEPFDKVELLVRSGDDPRFSVERTVHTVYGPPLNYAHFLSSSLLEELGIRRCASYSFRLKGTLASGRIIFSGEQNVRPSCLGVEWIAGPETVESCDATPSGRLKLTLKPFADDGRKLTQLLLGQKTSSGEEILNNWNDIRAGSDYIYMLDTAQTENGRASYFTRLINEDGREARSDISVVIDHQAPTTRISYPAEGQKLCGIKARDPYDLEKLVNVVPIEASVTAGTRVSYGLEYQTASTSGEWKVFSPAAMPAYLEGFGDLRQDLSRFNPQPSPLPVECAYPDATLCADFHPIQWTSEKLKAKRFEGAVPKQGELGRLGLFEKIEGEVSVRLRAFSVGGHQICTPPVTFEFDNKVRVTPSFIDRRIFSPNGDEQFDAVQLTIAPDESVNLDVEVFKANRLADGRIVATGTSPVRTIVRNAIAPEGESIYSWDGMDDANARAPDGLYAIRVTYSDGCDNKLVEERITEVDATPPQVTLVNPIVNAQAGLIVPVLGAIKDLHFQSYAVQYETAGASDVWVPLVSSERPTPADAADHEILNWNTLGLTGPVTLRVIAVDSVANTTDIRIPLEITARNEITYLEAVPTIFSPNADNKSDTGSIRFGMMGSAKVTLEVFGNSGGATPLKTLAENLTVPAGASVQTWNGANAGGTVQPDGRYSVKLTATALDGTSFRQEESTLITIDNTPPKVTISYPDREFVTARGNVMAAVSDLHLDSYRTYFARNPSAGDWRLVEEGAVEQSGSVVAALEGLEEGKYGVKVVAVDKAENATEVVKLFEIDNTPPKPAISFPAEGSYLSALKGPFNIAGALEERNLSAYQLRYGQGAPSTGHAELAAGTTLPLPAVLHAWDVAAIADGPYSLSLTAEDKAGQSGQARVNVIIDNTPPVAVITLPADKGYVKQPMSIVGTASDAHIKDYKLEIAPGAKATASRWTEIGAGTISITDGSLLAWQALPPDGVHTLRLTATDKAGNSTETLVETTVDTKPPAAPLNLSAKLENRRDAHLSWNANSEPDIVGYKIFRNGTLITETPVTGTVYVDAGLPSGSYTYIVKAIDKAGWDSEASNAETVVVSLSTPVAQIFSPVRDAFVSGLVDVKGNAKAERDFKEYRLYVGAGEAPTDWQLLRRSPVPIDADILGPWNTIGLSEAIRYSIKLEAEDLNKVVSTDTIVVSVDNTPPAAPIQLQAAPTGSNVLLTWTPSTSPDVIGYILFRGEKIANAQGPVVGSLKPYLIVGTSHNDVSVPDGTHVYVVHAMDKAENLSDPSNTATVTIDTRAPRAVIVTPETNSDITKTTYLLATTPDTDVASVQFQYRPASGGAWFDIGSPVTALPYAVNWDPSALSVGAYQLRAVATDTTGKTDPSPAWITVNYTNPRGPEIDISLTAKVDGGVVDLNWTSSSTEGVAQYILERVNPDGEAMELTRLPADAISYLDEWLEDGLYRYRLHPLDAEGDKGKPSNDANALVYTPEIEQPYTPTSDAVFPLRGRAQPGAKVRLFNDDTGDDIAELDPADDGSFVMAEIAQGLGGVWYGVSQTDANGNRSKDAWFYVMRADPPAAPTGVNAVLNGEDITLNWDANTEPDLAGYRVIRKGQVDTESLELDHIFDYWASSYRDGEDDEAWPDLAFDNDVTTGWAPDTSEGVNGEQLELYLDEPRTLSEIKLTWAVNGVVKDYDLELWGDEVWVPVAKVRGNTAAEVNAKLAKPYRTDALRITLRASDAAIPRLAEVAAIVFPEPVPDASWMERSNNGEQIFQVFAQNRYGMFSAPTEFTQPAGVAIPLEPVELNARVRKADVILDWSPSTAFNVAYYEIFRDGVPIAQHTDLQNLVYTDAGRPQGSYTYTVRVVDATNAVSPPSNEQTVTVTMPQFIDPVITGPTVSGLPIETSHPYTDVSGYAQPGSTVALLKGGEMIELGSASAELQSKAFKLSDEIDYFEVTRDGRWLLASLYNGDERMEITDLQTGSTTRLPTRGDLPVNAKWSHDGQRIAFAQYDNNRDAFSLYTYKLDDKSVTRESELKAEWGGEVAWSPDGRMIAMAGYGPQWEEGLWLFDRVTNEHRQLRSDSVWSFDNLQWSPDGSHIALENYSTVQVIRVSDGVQVFTHNQDGGLPDSYSSSPSWSLDGKRLIYEFYGRNYMMQVGEFDLMNGTFKELTDDMSQRQRPAWTGRQGEFLSVGYQHGIEELVLSSYDRSYEETLVEDAYNLYGMKATPNGHIFYLSDYNEITRLTLPGVFRISQVRLSEGANQFAAYSTTTENVRSNTSAPIQVSLSGAAGIADLSVSESGMTVLPGLPLANEATRVTAVIRNDGSAQTGSFDVVLAAKNPAGQVIELTSRTLPSLAAGESIAIAADWTPADIGQHVITVIADRFGQVAELNEANNAATRSVTVTANSMPTLSVATDAPSYSANSALKGTVTVLNPGARFSGKLLVRIEDKEGYLVEELPAIDVTELPSGSTADYLRDWNTGTTLSGDYRMTAELRDIANTPFASRSAAFRIDTERQVQATIASDRAQYRSQESATISGNVRLESLNANLENATAFIQIVNGDGAVVSEFTQTLGTLLPQTTVAVSSIWNTSNNPTGAYTAKLTVKQGEASLAVAQTAIEIVIDAVAQLAGSLQLSENMLANGDRLVASYVLQNTGGLALTALPTTVSIVDPDTQAVIASSVVNMDVAVGASAPGQAAFNVDGWPLKALQSALSVQLDGKTVVLQRATLRVVDRIAPVVRFTTPAQGALMRSTGASVVLNATDRESGVTSVEYTIEGSPWKPMPPQNPSLGLYAFELPALEDGPRQIQARATDGSNNVSEVARLDIVIDNTPPLIVVSGVAEGGRYPNEATPNVTVSDVNLQSVTMSLDGQPFVSGSIVNVVGVHLLQIDAEDKAGNKSSRTLNFTVVPVLEGTLAATPKAVNVGNAVQLAVSVTNKGSAALAGLQYQVTISDSATQQIVHQFTDSGDLAPQASYGKEFSWITAGAAGTTLKVTLAAKHGTETLELANDSFMLVSPEVKLSGALTVSPAEIEAGGTVVLSQQVSNIGANATSTKINLVIVEKSTGANVHSASQTVNLATAESWQLEGSWTVTGPEGTAYRASLSAETDGKVIPLAQADFVVIGQRVRLNLSYGPSYPQRMLVLAQCKRAATAYLGQCGASPIPVEDPVKLAQCDSERAQAADGFLNLLGIAHKTVTSESEFARELRSGAYSGYWVSGGGTKLRQPLQSELKAALRQGDALVADGLHSVRQGDQALTDLLSTHYHGQFQAGSTQTISMLGKLFAAGDYPVLGDVLKLGRLASGRTEAIVRKTTTPGGGCSCRDDDDDEDDDECDDDDGEHDGDDDECDDESDSDETDGDGTDGDGTDGDDGDGDDDDHECTAGDDGSTHTEQDVIISGTFGGGRTLFFGFDWINTMRAQPQETRWNNIGRAGFNWLLPVQPDAAGPLIGADILTLSSTVRNQGQDAVLSIVAKLPIGAKAIGGSHAVQIQSAADGDTASWQITLAAGTEQKLDLQLRLPGESGGYAVAYTVNSIRDGIPSLFGTDSVPLPVIGVSGLIAEARSAIGALTVGGDTAVAAKAEAMHWLGQAEMSAMTKSYGQALREAVMAQSRLDAIQGMDLAAAQRAVARLLTAIERQIQ